jgi:hypothetical protein
LLFHSTKGKEIQMVTKKKAAPLPADEVKADAALKAFLKSHEGKTLTEAQKEHKAELKDTLGSLRFVRIANKRVPRVLAAIESIGKLAGAGYSRTEAQSKAISTALETAAKQVSNKLLGVKAASSGFALPVEDEKE